MFDPETAAAIAGAPALKGVDRERLSAVITDAYVRVAVTSSLLGDDTSDEEGLFDELRSIAAAQEAIALRLEPGELRASAAFVSASAYRVMSERAVAASADTNFDSLSTDGVSTRLCAMLLFLTADASADANEVADDLRVDPDDDHIDLLNSLRSLGAGDLRNKRDSAIQGRIADRTFPSDVAADIGYDRCHALLLELLDHLASPPTAQWEMGAFERVAAAMTYELEVETPQGSVAANNIVMGPWHLARLLHLAEPALVAASTAALSSPPAVDPSRWRRVVERVARRRPLLWRNHRQAIELGLLEPGVSAVLAFPTGAGKSTISELKVATAVIQGKNVVCLVPTLSLIDQLANSLRSAIPGARVTAQRDLEDTLPPASSDGPEIFVMTPESCFAALGVGVERFGDVGLVMFDEAHLMHLEGTIPSRRAVDASLCFLSLTARYPDADLLLVSAMLENADELAQWLRSITGRKAIALDSPWKPTRQARGALLYHRDETEALRQRVVSAFETGSTITPPVRLRQTMLAQPYGLFSLKSTWESGSTRDYRFVPLLQEPVQLEVRGNRRENARWWLSPNSNAVAAKLSTAAAQSGLKTLVFAQQVGWASKIAADVSQALPRRTELLPAEVMLLGRCVELLGDASALYLEIDDGAVLGSAIPHHGLLLPEERRLHEQLYRRRDGVPVMAATSTISQGMNFPSELVIIASDWRFDPETSSRIRLEAHELLNAAGRAGRAGSHSNALVLVIPGEVVSFDGVSNIGQGWFALRETFSKSDQCLVLVDPLSVVLDSFGDDESSPLLEYVSRRIENVADSVIGPPILRKSLAAFAARNRGDYAWVDERIELLQTAIDEEAVEPWLRRCALISGLPVSLISHIATRLRGLDAELGSLVAWSNWFLDVLRDQPAILEQVLRSGSRAAMRGTEQELGTWESAGVRLVEQVRKFLMLWMQGATLQELHQEGIASNLARASDKHFEFARKFVLRVIPDLAYLFGLPALILEQRATFGLVEELSEGHPLALLARAVDAGVDTTAKLYALEMSPAITRQRVHKIDPDFL